MPAKDVYTQMRAESKKLGETNDCTVKALAILAGVDYKEAHEALRRLGRQPKKGTSIANVLTALQGFGCWVSDKIKPESRTVRTLERTIPLKGRYLVSVNRHVLAIVDGVVHDWTRNGLKRIQYIYEVSL